MVPSAPLNHSCARSQATAAWPSPRSCRQGPNAPPGPTAPPNPPRRPRPAPGRLPIVALVPAGLERAARPAGATAALDDDVESLPGELRPVQVVPGKAPAVGRADKQRGPGSAGQRNVVIGAQHHAVAGRNVDPRLDSDGAHRRGEAPRGHPPHHPDEKRQLAPGSRVRCARHVPRPPAAPADIYPYPVRCSITSILRTVHVDSVA